jgi:dTDP-4-dehydrorhamnose reductase
MRVLVVGAAGLLGHMVFRVLSERREWAVLGTCRTAEDRRYFASDLARALVVTPDLESEGALGDLFRGAAPDVVINCLGGRRSEPLDPAHSIRVYGLFPRLLAQHCRVHGARLIQVSSDGVFSGAKGNYSEDDIPDARDPYGIAKLLGEQTEMHAISLRTSMIGPDPKGQSGLLEWFLRASGPRSGYSRAVFSGLPTPEIGRIIRDFVIPRPGLFGVYHVAANPISKFDLLRIVAEQYGVDAELVENRSVVMDRSLDARRFRDATGYVPDAWPDLIRRMHDYRFGAPD